MVGVDVAGSMVVEDDVDLSLVCLCDHQDVSQCSKY
jgi:hypothetical protein